ncbi:MAG: hypothetical protein L0Z71_01115 [Anaerolineae bacterium]|nr:hypothetical protein [Anaerolineae bacterium]
MRKLSALFMLIVFIVSACTFNVEVLTPEVLTPTASTPAETLAITPISIATVAGSPSTTPTPVLSVPQFSNARFTIDVSATIYQNIFPARTRRVYAVWDYQNMRAGLMIRRDWYFNDVLWITREEAWDFSKYGASGTIQDVSVFDLDVGLESGNYRFEMYIDMQPQPIGGVTWPLFTISDGGSETRVTSPNGQWVADADDPSILLLRDTGKNMRQLFSGTEITNLAWLPDSQRIVFVDRDRSQQQAPTDLGIRDDLWIVEILSGESHLLYQNTVSFGNFSPSPDGHYIASIEGSGFGDACFVDSRLIFFELASDFRSIRSIKQEQFSGISAAQDTVVYPVEEGTWQSETEYLAPLNGTCNFDQNLVGTYVFDLSRLNAQKTGQ